VTIHDSDGIRHSRLVNAFLAAARNGDFSALLTVLDPDAVLRADEVAVQMGATQEIRGAAAVAETFSGRAQVARSALVDGAAGAVWMVAGRPRVVFSFRISHGNIVEIDLIADPERVQQLEVTILDD
jgi:RNA polymerase sigma-70 factor (ECF subfamily)